MKRCGFQYPRSVSCCWVVYGEHTFSPYGGSQFQTPFFTLGPGASTTPLNMNSFSRTNILHHSLPHFAARNYLQRTRNRERDQVTRFHIYDDHIDDIHDDGHAERFNSLRLRVLRRRWRAPLAVRPLRRRLVLRKGLPGSALVNAQAHLWTPNCGRTSTGLCASATAAHASPYTCEPLHMRAPTHASPHTHTHTHTHTCTPTLVL